MKSNENPLTADTRVIKSPIKFIAIKESIPVLGRVFTNAPPSPIESEIVGMQDFSHFSLACKIKVTINIKDSDGCFCKGKNNIYAKLTLCTNEEKSGEISDNNDGSCTASFTPTRAGLAMLSVHINGQPIKESPRNIIVSTKDYQKVSFLEQDVFQNSAQVDARLSSVASSYMDGRWALADEVRNCIGVFDKSNLSWSKKDGVLNSPKSIAFDSKNDLYVLVDSQVFQNNVQAGGCTFSGYIHKFNTVGEYLHGFGMFGSDNGQLKNPGGIAAHYCKVYVADTTNKRIAVFWCDGRYCSTIGGEDTFVEPCDVAVNYYFEEILVCDSGASCIVAYTLEGTCTKIFSTNEEIPRHVAIDVDGLILVTSSNGIHVFDCAGNPIPNCIDCTTYRKINGIAVRRNGSIIVVGEKSFQLWN